MSCYNRLNRSFEGALRLPLTSQSKFVLISDCHRGNGASNDIFLKNQNLYYAALTHYFKLGFSYIELGDGDELWENRNMDPIIETHSNTFWLLSLYYQQNRLYMLYGNHDMVKKNAKFSSKTFNVYRDNVSGEYRPLFPDMPFYSGIILENNENLKDLYLTHGHQADMLNSTLWKLSRFLVRYLWEPLKRFGVLDPTSAAKNYTRKHNSEQRLSNWAKRENHILITGHTHRPVLDDADMCYLNTGSCVHPRCITCLEVENMQILLVKWTFATRPDMTLYVSREVLAGPVSLTGDTL